MKKIFFTFILGVLTFAAFSQEQAIYSHYYVVPVLINPGYTGFDNQHQVIADARSTWTGFPGKPTTYTLMYNGPVGDKLALGGGLFSEKLGDINTMKLQLNYAFRFKLQKAQIGLGLSTDFLRRQADVQLLDDPLVDLNDEDLENLVDGQSIFDATIGAHVLYDNKFFIDLTLPNTIRARLDEVPVAETNTAGNSALEHYVFQLGYIVDVPQQNFKVIPSIAMRKIRDTPYQIDLNVQGRFMDEKLIAGFTVRPSYGGAAAFMLGTSFSQFKIYYAYDVAFSKFQQYNTGSHELSFVYQIKRRSSEAVPAGQ